VTKCLTESSKRTSPGHEPGLVRFYYSFNQITPAWFCYSTGELTDMGGFTKKTMNTFNPNNTRTMSRGNDNKILILRLLIMKTQIK
jgi:hypothetical protein